MNAPPPCAHCGERSVGLASSGAEPMPGKAVLGYPSCPRCKGILNELVSKLVFVTFDASGRQVVTPFVSGCAAIEKVDLS
jgi:hypothetical protein